MTQQNDIVISTEARAARLFEAFVAEHNVPEILQYDLLEEIKLAIDCYGIEETDDISPMRQSELYNYMESYLVKWVADLRESRLPDMHDLKSWGYFDECDSPEVLIQPLTGGVRIVLRV